MMIQAKFAAIKGIQAHEYVLRFVFGGLCCVAAGLIAKHFGPRHWWTLSGVFPPSSRPAPAWWKHTNESIKPAQGLTAPTAGRSVASIDAAGASIGCIGLAGFALVCWLSLPRFNTALVFLLASAAWFVLAVAFWLLRKSRLLHR